MLNVVNGDGIAGKQGINVAFANDFAEGVDASGVNDYGSGDEDNPPFFTGFDAFHHFRNADDGSLSAAFRRNIVRHKCEAMTIAFFEFGLNFNAVNAADN